MIKNNDDDVYGRLVVLSMSVLHTEGQMSSSTPLPTREAGMFKKLVVRRRCIFMVYSCQLGEEESMNDDGCKIQIVALSSTR